MGLTHMTSGNINEALEECSKRTVLCGLGQAEWNCGLQKEKKAHHRSRCCVFRTHHFIQLSNRRAGNLLHVVCRKPQLFLSSVVTSPPADNTGQHREMWRRATHIGSDLYTEKHSPATLLFVHIQDERLFGETELIFPLSSIVIQSFDCTLKHMAAGVGVSLYGH